MADPIVVTPESNAPTGPSMGPGAMPSGAGAAPNLPSGSAPASFSGGSPATGGGVGSPGFNPTGTTAGQSRPGFGAGIGSGVSSMQRSALAAQAADTQHHSMLGKAARFLLGHQIDYQVDDKGNVRQVEVPQKPGQLFRSILAGAILGGAMGAERQRGQPAGFGPSFARGGAAVQEKLQEADQNRYNRAVQQFQMKQQASAAKTEDELKKVQIAMHNSQIATQNFLLNKGVFDQTIQSAIDGKAMYEPFLKAGVQAQFQDVAASKMLDLWKTNPQAQTYLWLPTGYRMAVNEKGEQYPELTYTAVDPKGKVALTDGAIKKFNDVHLSDYYAGAKELKAGQEMDATHYMALMQAYNDRYNQQMTEIRDDLQNKRYTAETKKYLAEQARDWAEVAKVKLDQKEITKFQTAQKHLAEVGYDPTKLDQKYPGDSAVLADYAGKLLKDESAALKAAQADNPDGEETRDLMRKVQVLSGWVNYVFQPPPPPGGGGVRTDKVNDIVQDVTGKATKLGEDAEAENTDKLSPQDAYTKIASSNLSQDEKLAAWKQANVEVPWEAIVDSAKRQSVGGKTVTADQVADAYKKMGIRVEKSPGQQAQDRAKNIPESVFNQY